MLPPSLMARLRLAMLLPHLLKQPRDRGRPDRPLQLFIFRKPLSLPASSPFSPPPLRGAPFLTAAFLLRKRQYWSQSKKPDFWSFFAPALHPLLALPPPFAASDPSIESTYVSCLANITCCRVCRDEHRGSQEETQPTEEALKECNVTRIEARRHEHSTVIEKPQRTSDDVRDTLCEQ